MARFLYCYVDVFGSDFDAEGFGRDVNLPGAEVQRREKGYVRSLVPALVRGNVGTWKTPKHYYKPEGVDATNPFGDYLYEEKAIVSFVKKIQHLNNILPSYRTDTTETWLHLIYGATDEEKPSGVFFGKDLIEAVACLGASISTEVIFVTPDELN